MDKFAEVVGEAWAAQSIRRRAVKKCAEWMLERLKDPTAWAPFIPPMQYSVMALDVLGYRAGPSPCAKRRWTSSIRLMVDDERGFFFQPCFSPVWDTAIAAFALAEAEAAAEICACSGAVDWLLSKEIRRRGDWSVKRPNVEPSGWCFEFANEYYPDIDDTAMVLLRFEPGAWLPMPRSSRHARSARSTGCWRCKGKTAAGRRSTSTTTGSS